MEGDPDKPNVSHDDSKARPDRSNSDRKAQNRRGCTLILSGRDEVASSMQMRNLAFKIELDKIAGLLPFVHVLSVPRKKSLHLS